MSKLEELIQKYCPDGVEYKPLGDVCSFSDGFPLKSDDIKEQGVYPVIKIGNINKGVVIEQNSYLSSLPQKIKQSQMLVGGEILVGMSGSTGKAGYNLLQKAIVNQRIAIIRNNDLVLNSYLKHCIINKNFESYCFNIGTGPQHNISKFDLLAYEIPVPSLLIQEEVVKVLDTFSKLQTGLETELQKRKQQYEYYQSLLLNKSQFQTHLEIREVCSVKKGNTAIQKAIEGPYPMVVTTQERRSCNHYQFDASAVCIPLVSSRGHGVASLNHVYYQEGKFALGNILCAVIPVDESVLNAKFLYYYLEYTKDYTLVPLMKGGANVSMHCSDIEKVKIPIPTIQEQVRIISILDKFDSLTNDHALGLPAEIEKRRQQYEFYRDKLLTFKRKEA